MKRSMRCAMIAGVGLLMSAGVTASAGTYKTISIDGDFGDWADVPAATTDGVDLSPIDFTQIKLANDDSYLYILLNFAESVNPDPVDGSGVYTAIDSDNNNSTGYDPFSLGVIGANTGFQKDFPFTQAAGNFNSGGSVSNTAYLASPYNTATTTQEIAIPLSTIQVDNSTGGYSGTVFTPTFGIAFYSTDGSGDITPKMVYSLAAVPEPGTIGLLGTAALLMLRRRRR